MTIAPRITKLIALLAILAFALFGPHELSKARDATGCSTDYECSLAPECLSDPTCDGGPVP